MRCAAHAQTLAFVAFCLGLGAVYPRRVSTGSVRFVSVPLYLHLRVCKSKTLPAFYSLLQFNGAIENVASLMVYVIYVWSVVVFG